MRLARNVRGYPFVSRLSAEAALELCERLRLALLDTRIDGESWWVPMSEASSVLRLLLLERNLISHVPLPHAGHMRRVYPGFVQLTAFMSMNLERHQQQFRNLYQHLVAALERGVPMIAPCNGFQIAVQAGLLPGPALGAAWPAEAPRPTVALADNASARFVDRWVRVNVPAETRCVWTRGLHPAPALRMLPVAHGEGRLIARDAVLESLRRNGQVALRYESDDNPNGSADDIASLTAYAKNLGLAFQIVDDLLDVIGTTEETGKVVRADARKTTFVSFSGVEGARELADDLCRTAMEALTPFGRRADRLRDLARFVTSRRG